MYGGDDVDRPWLADDVRRNIGCSPELRAHQNGGFVAEW